MSKRVKAAIALLLSLYLVGCSINPVTGEKEFSLISTAQELAIGEQNYQPSQQAQGGRYYIDPDLQFYVSEVGKKLAAVSDSPDLPYEFVVLNNSVPNAWALPGGKIAVNRGLLVHLNNEAELAAVLGHEIVHAAARHSAAQMTRGTLIGAGSQILGIALSDSSYGPLANSAIQLGSAAWLARYGRSAELESDAYGMEYMARAGYDPYGAVKLQQTFVKLNEGKRSDFISGLFASHPPSQTRVEANRAKAQTLPVGETYPNRYRSKIAQLKRDEPAYQAQGKAIKALNKKNAELALKHLDKAVKIQPDEGYSWELRGHAWKMQNKLDNADKAFSTAIRKNPEFFSHHLARGMLRYDRGDKANARKDLEKSHQLLPTQAASYLLGELSMADNNSNAALKYYQSAAQGGGKLGKQAQSKIIRLDLPKSPHKYIASQTYIDKEGYLSIAVRNSTDLPVKGVNIQLDRMANAYSVQSSTRIAGPKLLQPGQEKHVQTGLGPFESTEEARFYRSRVIEARPQ